MGQSGILVAAGSSQNKLRKHEKSRKTIKEEYTENATQFIKTISDNETEVIEAPSLHVAVKKRKDTSSQSIPLLVKENLIETKLEKVLTETVLNELSKFLNDIRKFDISDEVLVDCGFWDFAGQRYYYATHPIFLNPNAVNLLVANIMKDIKQINTEDGFDKIGKYVDFWFDSVHLCRDKEIKTDSSGKFLHPPVIVVCTGIDNCKDNLDGRKKEFRQQITSLLDNESKKKH